MPDFDISTEVRELITFCTEGDIVALKLHIEGLRQIDTSRLVNTATSSGQTLLIAACRNGKFDIVKYLVDECNANVELVGTVHFDGEAVEGVTPLWCASAANYLNIVRFLVKRGANVNATTATNSTALRAACFDGHEEVVRFLVEQGANVETPNRHEHTCLMIACFRGHENIVRFLLTRGARVNRRSAKGNTALHDCTESGNLRSLILLLNYGAIMRADEFGQTPIISGANSAYKKIVDYLCEMQTPSGEFVIPIEEQAAAHELLGASFYDRQSRVEDAIIAWQHAMNLRQKHFGYTKRLPSVTEGVLHHYAWALIEPAASKAVALELARKKRSCRFRNLNIRGVDPNLLSQSPVPPPSAISDDPVWSKKFESRNRFLTEQYRRLLEGIRVGGDSYLFNWKAKDINSQEQKLISAVDAVLGVEPDFLPSSSRHIRRPFEGLPGDVTPQEMSLLVSNEEYLQKYLSVPEDQLTRWVADPCGIFDSVEADLCAEEEARGSITSKTDEVSKMIRRLRRYSLAAFGTVREFADFNELRVVHRDTFALQLQPLLIRLRILGPDHPDTIYFLRYRGATYADSAAITHCLAFWRYAVELQRVFLEPLSYVAQSSFLAFVELYNLVLTNRYAGLRAVHFPPSLLLDSLQLAIDNVERGMDYSYPYWQGRTPWSYTSADKEATNLHRHVTHCLHFIALLAYYFCSPSARPRPLHRHRLAALRQSDTPTPNADAEARRFQSPIFSGAFPLLETPSASATGVVADPAVVAGVPVGGGMEESATTIAWSAYILSESEHTQMRSKMTPELFEQFCFQVNRLVRLDPRVHEGASLMHLAATASRLTRYELFPLPHADLLRLLAALGADPDALDTNGYRPVGRILTTTQVLSDIQKAELVRTLVLDCGAHFDASVMPPPKTSFTAEFDISDDDDIELDHTSNSDGSAANEDESESSTINTGSARRDEEPSKTYREANTWPSGSVCKRLLSLSGLKPLKHVNLACLAARAIPPTLHHLVPPLLIEFVRFHHFQPTKQAPRRPPPNF